MKNKKLLKYFTEQILPILDEIEFNDKGAEYLVDIEHKQVGTLNMPKVEKIININEVK